MASKTRRKLTPKQRVKRIRTPESQYFRMFTWHLEKELQWRYAKCEDFAATPSSILLAVLNAVAEARKLAHGPDPNDRGGFPIRTPRSRACG